MEKMKNEFDLSIIIPCYNADYNTINKLCRNVDKLLSIFRGITVEFIVVDDGSHNSLISTIEHQAIRVLKYNKNKGKGYAIRYGAAHATAENLIYCDVDFPFGLENVYKTYQELKRGADLVISERRDLTYFDKLPMFRKVLSRSVHLLNRTFICQNEIIDTQAGLKGLSNKAKQLLLHTKTNSFVFEIEFVRLCLLHDLSYKKISVDANPDIQFTNFRAKVVFQESINLVKIICQPSQIRQLY